MKLNLWRNFFSIGAQSFSLYRRPKKCLSWKSRNISREKKKREEILTTVSFLYFSFSQIFDIGGWWWVMLMVTPGVFPTALPKKCQSLIIKTHVDRITRNSITLKPAKHQYFEINHFSFFSTSKISFLAKNLFCNNKSD